MYTLPIYSDFTKVEEKAKKEQQKLDEDKVVRNDYNPKPYQFDRPTNELASEESELPNITIQPEIEIKHNEKIENGKVKFTRFKEPQDDHTLPYRKIMRKPILKEIVELSDKFTDSVGTADAAMYYSFIKEKINTLWNYIDKDEPFGIVLVTFESVLNLNEWKNYSKHQAKILKSSMSMLQTQNINMSDMANFADGFIKAGLNILPSIDIDGQNKQESVKSVREKNKK